MLLTTIIWDAFWFQTVLRIYMKENRHDFEEKRNKFPHNGALAMKLCPKSLEGTFGLADIQILVGYKVLNNLI